MKRFFSILGALVLVACSGDDSTNPSADQLDGTWRFSFSNVSGTRDGTTLSSCTIGVTDFTIAQTGSTFTGSQVGSSTAACTVFGVTVFSQSLTGLAIIDGQISGSTITFGIAGAQGQQSATITGNSISGTLHIVTGTTGDESTLDASFTATKL